MWTQATQHGGARENALSANLALLRNDARVQVVSAAPGLKVTLPSALLLQTGGPLFYVINSGANAFSLRNAGDVELVSLGVGEAAICLLEDNSTAAGVWRVPVYTLDSPRALASNYDSDPCDEVTLASIELLEPVCEIDVPGAFVAGRGTLGGTEVGDTDASTGNLYHFNSLQGGLVKKAYIEDTADSVRWIHRHGNSKDFAVVLDGKTTGGEATLYRVNGPDFTKQWETWTWNFTAHSAVVTGGALYVSSFGGGSHIDNPGAAGDKVYRFDWGTGAYQASADPTSFVGLNASALLVMRNDDLILGGGNALGARLYQLNKSTLVATVTGDSVDLGGVNHMVQMPTGRRIVAGGPNGVALFEEDTLDPIRMIELANVYRVGVLSDGRIVVISAGDDSDGDNFHIYNAELTEKLYGLSDSELGSTPTSLAVDSIDNVYVGLAGNELGGYAGRVVKLLAAEEWSEAHRVYDFPGEVGGGNNPVVKELIWWRGV